MKNTRNNILLVSICLLGLIGCAQGDGSNDTANRVFPYVRLASSAPPQAPYEEFPAATQPMNELWRKGYWDYDGKEFFWVPGRFIPRPDPTAAWTPDRWEQRAFGWAFIPGFWQ